MTASEQSNTLRPVSTLFQPPSNSPLPRFKCIILGDPGAGKSCLFDRIIHDKFSDIPRDDKYIYTLRSAIETTRVPLPSGDFAQVQLWDTVGHDRSGIFPYNYLRGARAVLLVYDVTKSNALFSLESCIRLTEDQLYYKDEPLYFVVGTKMDLGDANSKDAETAKTFFQEKVVLDWFCVSSKTGENVKEMIKTVAKRVLERLPKNNGVVTLSAEENKDSVKKKCC